jgi:prepilin-type N-terminal cleavage/methylation domain-containing protein
MDKRHGLTLLELLTVMAIIGTTIFCIPPMIKWMNQQGVRHAVEQLRADLQLARVMAIRKKQTCTVTFNKPGPNQETSILCRSVPITTPCRTVSILPAGE